mgnify:CR=1 FL=1
MLRMGCFLGLLLLGGWLVAQEPPPPAPDAGAFPEPVTVPGFMPQSVLADRAMVAAAHPLAARAGVEIMAAGGNAIDAMVAVQMVLNVVEPQSSGIGGGCFILWHDVAAEATHFVDGREECPRAARREQFLGADGQLLPESELLTGGAAVGVPGTVAAMHRAHRLGGKLPWADLFAPAIRLAAEGIGVTPRLRWAIQANQQRFLRFPASRAVFLMPDGGVPEIGHVLRQPDLARTLRLIADQGPEVFYKGELARLIVAAVQGAPVRPGSLTLADLAEYRPVRRQPFSFDYRGHRIVGPGSPSAGAHTLALMLAVLEEIPPAERQPGTLEQADALARAESVAFACRGHLGDWDFTADEPSRWLKELLADPTPLRAGARQMRPGSIFKWSPPRQPTPDGAPAVPLEGDHTTHFSIVDVQGNIVSCTTTIEHGMGCGLVVPGAGFLLNNELTDFDLHRTNGPNALESRRAPRRTALDDATAEGGKRPRSSMTPLIVFRDGPPLLTLGSPGGAKIIGVVAQSLIGLVDHDLDVQQAINLPRVSCRNRGRVELEGHFADRARLQQRLEALGWPVVPLRPGYEAWGGTHGIRRRPDGKLEGGADPRREGAARGM